MEPDNQTNSSEFILLGLSEKPEQETLLFALFLCMYVVTVVGNLLIILANLGQDKDFQVLAVYQLYTKPAGVLAGSCQPRS